MFRIFFNDVIIHDDNFLVVIHRNFFKSFDQIIRQIKYHSHLIRWVLTI